MDQAIEDRVGQGGIAEVLMPVRDRQLAGDDGRLTLMAIVEDLEQITPGLGREGDQTPIVDHEDVDAGELLCNRRARLPSARASAQASQDLPIPVAR